MINLTPFTGAGSVPIGGITRLANFYPPVVELNGQWFVKNGFVVTDGYDDSLEPYAILPSSWSFVDFSIGVGLSALVTDGKGTWIGGSSGPVRNFTRSIDNGETWDALDFASIDTRNGDTDGNGTWIFGIQAGQVARTTNNGETWEAEYIYEEPGSGHSTRVCKTDGNGVWLASMTAHTARSTDNGATWNDITIIPGQSRSFDRVSTDGNGVWIAVDTFFSGRVFRSTNNGVTWTQIMLGGSYRSVETDRNGVWLISTSTSRIYQSTDNGQTFTEIRVDEQGVNVDQIYTNRNGLWVGTSNIGIVISQDNGMTWNSIYPTNLGVMATDGDNLWISGNSRKSEKSVGIAPTGDGFEYMRFL